MKILSIRGATTITENSIKYIEKETEFLLKTIMKENNLDIDNFINIIFSSTKDITKAYPAKFARNIGFDSVPLMCLQEMYVENSLKLCIRVLITVSVDDDYSSDIKHIYLGEAKKLRPDLN